MTGFALIHGAWHDHRCWEPLIGALAQRGAKAVAVDLPVDEPGAGTDAYVAAVTPALDEFDDPPVVMAHSFGGLILPVVADRHPVAGIVYLAAFVPEPGMSFAEQVAGQPDMFPPEWAGYSARQVTHDDGSAEWPPDVAVEVFYPDCEAEVAATAAARLRRQYWGVAGEPCPLAALPDVPTRYVACRHDRAINPEWGMRVARERLGIEPEVIDSSHSPMLSCPDELAGLLLG